MDFSLIISKPIASLLIGDQVVYDKNTLPRLSGPDLCELCTMFGLSKTYTWGGVNQSRWEYMRDLMEFLNKQDRMGELLSHLFNLERFKELTFLGNPEIITKTYKGIIDGSIQVINSHLLLARKELRIIDKQFIISDIGIEPVILAPKVNVVTYQYIRELPDRIKGDIENEDYDSVITKSRTLLEEVLIYIIEKLTFERYNSNGDLNKIYQDATDLLNMRQQKDWDKRINSLLGGLHKIVDSISGMRNLNSDAHGAGAGRISINKREAILAANSSMMLAEYWLSVFEKK